jgi:serine/threonine protein kinase
MQFKAGDTFGRYRVEGPLGAGGMGAVYRAHDTLLERSVAIKVLSSAKEGSSGVKDILREARSAGALNHPNVCTIYEVGEEGVSNVTNAETQRHRDRATSHQPKTRAAHCRAYHPTERSRN